MKKYRIFFRSFEQEEKWINDIIKKGYRLVNVKNSIGQYEFIPYSGNPCWVRIDFRVFNEESSFLDYITIFEDAGWGKVDSSKKNGIHYFEKISDACEDCIFSDLKSKAGIYRRLFENYMVLITGYIPFWTMYSIIFGKGSFHNIINLKDYYYTANLWEMEGWRFVFCFLWETPFAVGRCCSGLIASCILFILIFLCLRSYIQYRRMFNKK